MSRIFVRAQIVPRPAVESAVTHTRNEVGDEIVAEIVALVGRAPEVAGQRVHGEANAISQPTCEHPPIPTLRVEDEHGTPRPTCVAQAEANPTRDLATVQVEMPAWLRAPRTKPKSFLAVDAWLPDDLKRPLLPTTTRTSSRAR